MKTEKVEITLQRNDGSEIDLKGEVTDLQVITIMNIWLNRISETIDKEKGIQIMEELQNIKEKAKKKGVDEDQAFANQSLAFMNRLNCDLEYRKRTYAALSIIFGEEILDINFSIEEIGNIISVLTAPMYAFFGESSKKDENGKEGIEKELERIKAENKLLKSQTIEVKKRGSLT